MIFQIAKIHLRKLEVLWVQQPIHNSSKRLIGTKDVRWKPHLFPSFQCHVWISSQWASADDPYLLSLQLFQICLLARILPIPKHTDSSLHDLFLYTVNEHKHNNHYHTFTPLYPIPHYYWVKEFLYGRLALSSKNSDRKCLVNIRHILKRYYESWHG
jgi:hypothetical protein